MWPYYAKSALIWLSQSHFVKFSARLKWHEVLLLQIPRLTFCRASSYAIDACYYCLPWSRLSWILQVLLLPDIHWRKYLVDFSIRCWQVWQLIIVIAIFSLAAVQRVMWLQQFRLWQLGHIESGWTVQFGLFSKSDLETLVQVVLKSVTRRYHFSRSCVDDCFWQFLFWSARAIFVPLSPTSLRGFQSCLSSYALRTPNTVSSLLLSTYHKLLDGILHALLSHWDAADVFLFESHLRLCFWWPSCLKRIEIGAHQVGPWSPQSLRRIDSCASSVAAKNIDVLFLWCRCWMFLFGFRLLRISIGRALSMQGVPLPLCAALEQFQLIVFVLEYLFQLESVSIWSLR